jgi:glycosyltransferase involved in cell wall biosynthesis
MSVTVVIPTTGADTLFDAVGSVLEQTYDTNCLVVIDGPEFEDRTYHVTQPYDDHPRLKFMVLPENVGANGFYGHRVYAAIGHLLNTDYVCFLDQDNWFDPEHVSSLIDTIERKALDWAYSYRKIVDKQGQLICEDKCESLGKITHFVDTNCYMLSRQVAVNVGHVWNGGWGRDRVFYEVASKYYPNFDGSELHTVNYRLDGNPDSVTAEFFLEGNKRRA